MKAAEILERQKAGKLKSYDEMSLLEKLITRYGPDSEMPTVMAIDGLFAGIDTTAHTMAFLMYNLATNPDKQELLFKAKR